MQVKEISGSTCDNQKLARSGVAATVGQPTCAFIAVGKQWYRPTLKGLNVQKLLWLNGVFLWGLP